MVDYTLCKDNKCPIKKVCFRYMVSPGTYQSYFTESPYDVKNKKCDFFIRLNPVNSEDILENKAVKLSERITNLVFNLEINRATFDKAMELVELRNVFGYDDTDSKGKKKTKTKTKPIEIAPPVCEFKPPIVVSDLDTLGCST